MKVLFVYKYLTLGGVEAVLRTRLQELDRWGIEAHAWFFHDFGGREMFAEMPDRIHLGDPAECIELLREGSFDLVTSVDTEEIFESFAGSRDLPKLVVEAHSAYPPSLGYLSQLGALQPAAIFVPSWYHGNRIREKVGEGIEIRVVPNPVHPLFLLERAGREAPPARPVLAWVGRLDDFKNWPAFLEIVEILVRRGWDVEAWIVGRPVGPGGGEELIREARRTGVLDRLRWYRGLPHSAMPRLFDAVHDSGGAVITTSRGESFGLTIAEAMARRCAVVVPSEGPFQEFVKHGRSGLCYDTGSVPSAAEQVAKALADRALRERCGEEARSAIVAHHSPARVVGLLASELKQAAGREARVADPRLPAPWPSAGWDAVQPSAALP